MARVAAKVADVPPEPATESAEPAAEPNPTSEPSPSDVAGTTTDPGESGSGGGTGDAGSAADSAPPEGAAPEKHVPTAEESAFARDVRRREIQLEQRRKTHADERRALEQERTAFKSEIEQARAMLSEAKSDPIAFATKYAGFREEDIARRVLNEGKPHEKEIEYQRAQETTAREKALTDRIEKLQAMLEENVIKPRQQEQQRAGHAQAVQQYQGFVKREAAKYPVLAKLLEVDAKDTIADVDEMAERMLATANKTGQKWQSHESFWHDVSARYNARAAKLAGASAPPGAPASGSQEGSGKPPAREQSGTTKAAPTLSGSTSTTRATIPASEEDLVALEQRDPEAARARALKAIKDAKRSGATT